MKISVSAAEFPMVKAAALAFYGASVTLFFINQTEGNDGGGSDYSNTPSPHCQDLCPG